MRREASNQSSLPHQLPKRPVYRAFFVSDSNVANGRLTGEKRRSVERILGELRVGRVGARPTLGPHAFPIVSLG
jgi:hypothetical protein